MQQVVVFFLVTSSSTPVRSGRGKLQESSDFFDHLNASDSFKRKPRVSHHNKPDASGRRRPSETIRIKLDLTAQWKSWFEYIFLFFSSEDRGPLVEIKVGSSFLPESSSEATDRLRSPPSSWNRPAPSTSAAQLEASPLPALPKDVAVEKYSGLRLRSHPYRQNRFFFFSPCPAVQTEFLSFQKTTCFFQ